MKRIVLLGTLLTALVLVSATVTADGFSVGSKVPDFKLKDALSGREMKLSDFTEKGPVVLNFLSFKCPYSLSYDAKFVELAKKVAGKGAMVVGISPNNFEDEKYLAQEAKNKGITFPILKDWNNVIADMFGAQFTPHIYIIGKDSTLLYAGQAGDNIHAEKMKTFTCEVALDEVLAGKPVSNPTTKAAGCTIKRDANKKDPR